nr:MAG TPA: hypothetical protein [Caudoviricetes sp.]
MSKGCKKTMSIRSARVLIFYPQNEGERKNT